MEPINDAYLNYLDERLAAVEKGREISQQELAHHQAHIHIANGKLDVLRKARQVYLNHIEDKKEGRDV